MADITPFSGGRPGLLQAGRRSSDQRLARLASRGNARAFALLYERHHQALYRYCLAIVRAPEDAQDALQNTFMNAFAALRASERDVAVRPWLFRVAHNEAVSILGHAGLHGVPRGAVRALEGHRGDQRGP